MANIFTKWFKKSSPCANKGKCSQSAQSEPKNDQIEDVIALHPDQQAEQLETSTTNPISEPPVESEQQQ